jgi:hypothetical protein
MYCLHGAYSPRRYSAVTITAVKQPIPRETASETFLASLAVPEQRRAWANEPEIMKRLNYRGLLVRSRIVCSGRHDRERIMEVTHVHFLLPDQFTKGTVHPLVPNSRCPKAYEAHSLHGIVCQSVSNNPMAS